jgi:hypothetical protein
MTRVDTAWKFAEKYLGAQIFCGRKRGFVELETHAPDRRDGNNFCSFQKGTIFVIEISSLNRDDIVTEVFGKAQ